MENNHTQRVIFFFFFCRSHRGSSRRENRKSYRGGRWSLPWKFLGCSQDILRPGREIPYPDACLRHFLVSTFHATFEISKNKYIYAIVNIVQIKVEHNDFVMIFYYMGI